MSSSHWVSRWRCSRCLLRGALALATIWLLALPAAVSWADTVTYIYNSNGQLVKTTYGNGTVVTYSYDANGNRTAAVVTPPSLPAPTSLAATVASPSEIDLTWTAVSGATSYNIERCQGSGCTGFTLIGSAATGAYSDKSLSPSTTYVYRVQAIDSTNNTSSGWSSSVSAMTQADTTPPTAPANLSASAVSSSQINLSWSASTDNVAVAGYAIERCQGASCTGFTQIATTGGTSFSNTGLAEGVTYQYRVRAYDEADNYSGYSNTATASIADTSAPSTPTGLSASAASWSTVNLSWSASTDNVGVAGYKVYRNGSQIGTTGATTYTDGTTSPSTGYSYTVSAYDAAGNNSAQSGAASVTTPAAPAPAAPSSLTGTPVSNIQVNLSWSASSDSGGPGIAGYKVFRNGTQIGSTSATSFSDTGVSAFSGYDYTVEAYDRFGTTSAQSSTLYVYTAYQITDSNGNVLPSAASLYTVNNYSSNSGVGWVYIWVVTQPGKSGSVADENTSPGGSPPACSDPASGSVASGYQLQGCVLWASPSSYGH